MSQWWTYRLSDFLMFSGATWYRLLELHNAHWSPLHAVAVLAAVAICGSAFTGQSGLARTALVLAGLAWLFVGWAFHWTRYAPINWAAIGFAAGFGVQGILLVAAGLLRWPGASFRTSVASGLGALLLLLALFYPLLAPLLGRPFSHSEWFGLMPDPTALATLGLLLCLRPGASAWLQHLRRVLMLVPLLWCAATGATLWTLDAPEWFLLPLSGLAAILASWIGRPRAA